MTILVWERPVRLIHWTIFIAVIVLAVTGFYIGNPILVSGGAPTDFLMGTYRAIHVAAAWVFGVAVVARLIWAFIGNRYSRWDQFVPASRARRADIKTSFKYYLFMQRETPPGAGHNPLAGLTYLVLYAMFAVQIWTGLALASLADPGSFLWSVSGWTFSIVPIPTIRFVHHLILWLTLGFIVHHVYSATLIDVEERSGVLSSIVTGWKRIRPGQAGQAGQAE
jgi:Ni/Fe-hydrogenase, b-type cytochrome subunit